MKKILISLVTLTLVLLPMSGLLAQTSANANADATVVVNSAIAISAPTTINFGAVEVSTAVSLPADGSATTGIAGANVALGAATVTGTAGASFTVSFNNPTLSDGTNTVVVTADVNGNSTNSAPGSADLTSGGSVSLSGGGDYYLFLGGGFTAPSAAGTYNTTNTSGVPMTITVEYL